MNSLQRAALSERSHALWTDPEYRAKTIGAMRARNQLCVGNDVSLELLKRWNKTIDDYQQGRGAFQDDRAKRGAA